MADVDKVKLVATRIEWKCNTDDVFQTQFLEQ